MSTKEIQSLIPKARVYRLMNLFNENSEVPVADFVTVAKTLRGRMLTEKDSVKGKVNGDRYDKRKNSIPS